MRLHVERNHRAASLLLANEQRFADSGVLRWPPGKRKRLHHGEPLHGINRKSAGTDHIADDVDQALRGLPEPCLRG